LLAFEKLAGARLDAITTETGQSRKGAADVRMIYGERHRERVLTAADEALYFAAANSDAMQQHLDPHVACLRCHHPSRLRAQAGTRGRSPTSQAIAT